MSKFIEMVIQKHYQKGEGNMTEKKEKHWHFR